MIDKTHKMIDEIMDTFNFQEVETVMKILQWKVYMGEKYEIPDECELRKMARKDMWRLVEESTTIDGPYIWTRCGPFKVTIYKENNTIALIILDFVVTSIDVSDDEIDE